MKKVTLIDEEISDFCLELALLVHSGIGIGDGLALMAEESESDFRELFSAMSAGADSGLSLSRILRDSGAFPADASGMIQVGEQSGRIEEALRAVSEYYESRKELNTAVRNALLYPSVLMLLMVVVIAVLLAKVLPVFNSVLKSLGTQLTGVAGGLLAFGRILDAGMPVFCVLLAAVSVFFIGFAWSDSFRRRILSKWSSRDRGIPAKLAVSRFAQGMALGMRSGLPLAEALQTSAALLEDHPEMQRRCRDCQSRLDEGAGFAEALKESGLLSAANCRILSLGIRGGNGDSVMQEIARRVQETAQTAMEEKVSRIEPAMVIATSLIVGLILLCVMLPLMNIMSAIG